MKRSGLIYILILMLMGVFLLTGCDKLSFSLFDGTESEENDITPELQDHQEDVEANDNQESVSTENSTLKSGEQEKPKEPTQAPETVLPTANTELIVYTVNAEGNIEPVTALISEDSRITPELIVETVIESMADQSIIISVKNVMTENDTVIVNFTKENSPGNKNMGSGYEAAILDAVAQSLIDNLTDYSKVIYRIDDNAYTSGVFEFGIDEVYLGDNE